MTEPHEVPLPLDESLRRAVARETAATVTPPFESLSFRGRHRRIRQAFVGAVATAAVLTSVAVAVPRLGGDRAEPLGPAATSSGAALRDFYDIEGDGKAQHEVTVCMAAEGFRTQEGLLWGMNIPLAADPAFPPRYARCLAWSGYQPPPDDAPGVLQPAGCADFFGRPAGGGYVAGGVLGGHPWEVRLNRSSDGTVLCLTTSHDARPIEVVATAPDDGQVQLNILPLGDAFERGGWVMTAFVPEDVARVRLDVDGVKVDVPTREVLTTDLRALVLAKVFDGPIKVISGTLYDKAGKVVGRIPPGRYSS